MLELIPGRPTTRAEVWVWHGHVPDACDEDKPWVVLKADDWPMSPSTARQLASALIDAAARAEFW